MPLPVLNASPAARILARIDAHAPIIVAVAAACLIVAATAHGGTAGVAFSSLGGALLGVGAVAGTRRLAAALSRRRRRAVLTGFVADDAAPACVTDEAGAIAYENTAARNRFGARIGQTLVSAAGDLFPSPSAVFFRIRSGALARGMAREDVVTRDGHLRISAHRLGGGDLLWRFEDVADRRTPAGEGIGLPMMTLSRAGTVLAANEALCRLVGDRPATVERVVIDLPIRSGEPHQIATTGGPRRMTLVDVGAESSRREVYVLPESLVPTDPVWALLDALPVPLLKIAVTGEVLLSNRLARNLLEIEPGARPNLGDLITGLGRPVSDWLADAADGRGAAGSEVVRAARPAAEVFLQIALSRVEESDGVALVAVLQDATELKTLEAQFIQSQKMQAIGQLAGGVAHDFNNLLTAIRGHCDLLLVKRDPGHPDYADLEQINQNTNRAAGLVSQLLAFSRKQTLQPQLLDLRDTLSDLAHLLNRLVGEKITLALTHDPALKLVRADKRQLEQVLMNLVVNARDAMPGGGTISIVTEMRTLAQPLRRDRAVVPAGAYVVVRVVDQGIGIPADKLQKIFEPFFTTKKIGEGTGLGLSTAYGIVKQTGGFIFADSVVGSGTSFTILLPAHDAPAEEMRPAVSPAPPLPAHGDGVVLLVEDEAPVRAFASRALRMRGYTVVEAENAEEALEKLEDPSLEVDVFVTDVIMPGMDGPSWVAKALETRPDTRVVFVSGYAEDSLSENRQRIPNSVFLPKPFSLSDLTATVQSQLS